MRSFSKKTEGKKVDLKIWTTVILCKRNFLLYGGDIIISDCYLLTAKHKGFRQSDV